MDRPSDPLSACRRLYQESDIYAHFSNPDRNITAERPEVCTDLLELLRQYARQEAQVLVLGCAGGQESFALLRHGYEVTGLDIVPEFVEAAMSHAQARGFADRARFEVVDGFEWPMIADRSVDVVCMMADFVSVAGLSRKIRLALFAESRRVLRVGGVVFAQGHDRTHPKLKQPPPPWRPQMDADKDLKAAWGLAEERNVVVEPGHPCSGDKVPETPTATYKMDAREVWEELEESGLRVVSVDLDAELDPPWDCPSALLVAIRDPE